MTTVTEILLYVGQNLNIIFFGFETFLLNMKLLLEQQGRGDYKMISLSDFLLHRSHLQPGMNDTSALVGLLLRKLNQCFEVYISTK